MGTKRPSVGASDALAMLLGNPPERKAEQHRGTATKERPFARRSTRCKTCGYLSAYNYSFTHNHKDGFHDCGPFCTACGSDHVESEDVPDASRPVHSVRYEPDSTDPLPPF